MSRTKKIKHSDLAVVYARYSDGPNQTEQSIEGQVRDCKKYASDHSLTIVEYYIDRHISGKEDYNRAELQRLLHDSSKGQFDNIIIWKIDRFGRNREELALNKSKIKKNGVKLHYAMESIPDGPEGIILESVLEGLAEYYSADLSQKIRRGMRESAMKGKVMGNYSLFGYDRGADGHLTINAINGPIVREIFQRYADGEVAKNITEDFTARGLKTNRDKDFTPSFIYHMLRNRKYIGEYIYDDVVIPDAIPPIIDDSLWESVQERLKSNAKRPAAFKANVPFILSGKMICGYCGGPISSETGTSKTGKIHRYYKCRNKKSGKTKCQLKPIKKEWLEDFVFYHTAVDVLDDHMIDILTKEILRVQEEDSESFTITALRSELKEVQKAITNIMKAIEAGIFTDTTKDRLMELESRQEFIKISIAREELKKNSVTEEQIRFWLSGFRNGDIESESFQKKLLDSFINQIIVYEDKIVIAYNYSKNAHPISIEEVPERVRLHSPQVD